MSRAEASLRCCSGYNFEFGDEGSTWRLGEFEFHHTAGQNPGRQHAYRGLRLHHANQPVDEEQQRSCYEVEAGEVAKMPHCEGKHHNVEVVCDVEDVEEVCPNGA